MELSVINVVNDCARLSWARSLLFDLKSLISLVIVAPQNVRFVLFLRSNPQTASAIAAFNGLVQVVPIIIGVLIVGIIASVPYSAWMKRKVTSAS